jgi:hypothetical protein
VSWAPLLSLCPTREAFQWSWKYVLRRGHVSGRSDYTGEGTWTCFEMVMKSAAWDTSTRPS